MAPFRRVQAEFEAHLEPPHEMTGSARGKSERKIYVDGEERLKVDARGLALPDGTTVEIMVRGQLVGRESVDSGRVRLDVTNTDQKIPEIGPGDPIELRVGGRTHLRGTHRLD